MIKFSTDKKIWILETDDTAYVFGITPGGLITASYFGAKLPRVEDYPAAGEQPAWASFTNMEGQSYEEFSCWGGPRYNEPCLKVEFHDGVRDAVAEYKSHAIKENMLTVTLKDKFYEMEIDLVYEVFADANIIKKSSRVKNTGSNDIIIDQILSGAIYPQQANEYRLTHLCGRWIGETQLMQQVIPEAKITLESRKGFTGHHANPFFALDKNSNADEQHGEIYFGELAYSGNWKICIEKDNFNSIKITAGIHDFDFRWILKAGESFNAPALVYGYTADGFGQMSRNLHKYQLKYLNKFNTNSGNRKILYNSWEATFFSIDEAGQKKLAAIAAETGVELFVMDDGWFGERHSDKAGLGDWFINNKKFPEGLKGLINHVKSLGMDFGLWVEPEMINADSDLYREHPEWIYHFPNRKNTEMRNQLVLNLARKDVQQFVFSFMDKLLSENEISFIKWDLNRAISEPGYPSAEKNEMRQVWVEHTFALYEIIGLLKAKHPKVIFQSCSGGGGRVDMGVLEYFDQVWPSDNTDAFDRLLIQEGFTYAYCPKIMEAWVTDKKNWVNGRELSLEYRFHSCMMGNLGIGENLTKWNDEEKAEAKKLISEYKEIRHVIQNGELYRLLSPRSSHLFSVMYVTEDKNEAVLFAMLQCNHFGKELPKIFPQGLDSNSVYTVNIDGNDIVMSGKAFANIGIEIKLKGDFKSKIVKFIKMKVES